MEPVARQPAPAVAAGPPKRKLRNFLLDARFQLKFTSYIVLLTVIVAALMGIFLWRTTDALFRETEIAVEARSKAAEKSKELSNATLANEIIQHMEDPAFEAQLKEKAAAIDRAYESEKNAIIAAREKLVQQQKTTLVALVGGFIAFVVFIALASIVTTHKIVGPLFRVKRMVQEVAAGKLRVPTYGLRPGDELKDLFEAFTSMVKALRDREEDDLRRVQRALSLASQGGNDELVRELKALEVRLKAKLE